MKEKILASLKPEQIIESQEDGDFFAIHYTFPGASRWTDGIHGYAAIKGTTIVSKQISDGKASTNNRPETLAEFVANIATR